VIKCVHDAEAAYEGMRFRDALKASFFEMLLARDAYRDMCEKMEAPMHGPLVGGFIGALACLLAPVCPHFSRHVWGGMLARGAEPLAWPAAFAAKRPDPALLKADAYLSGKLHEFRLALLKASVGKPGKAGKAGAPPPAPRPTAATIVVAGGWPDWQRRPLQQLQGLWGPGGFTVADPLAEVKAAAMADAALKPFFKKLMPLAANAIAEQKEWTGEGLCPSLSLEAPFDEFGVWTDNAEYVRKALNLPEGVTVLRTGDAAFAEALAAAVARDVSGKNLLEVVVPLAPAIVPA
jgi:leucyl-tRNA synthetase